MLVALAAIHGSCPQMAGRRFPQGGVPVEANLRQVQCGRIPVRIIKSAISRENFLASMTLDGVFTCMAKVFDQISATRLNELHLPASIYRLLSMLQLCISGGAAVILCQWLSMPSFTEKKWALISCVKISTHVRIVF